MRITALALSFVASLLAISSATAQGAASPFRLNYQRITTDINPDLTSTTISELDGTYLTVAGTRSFDRLAVTFDPKTQDMEVIEAYITQPDGTRTEVGPEGQFRRPSQATQNAPGFVSTETHTILFPRIEVGSRIHTKWRLTRKVTPLFGFNLGISIYPTRDVTSFQVELRMPSSVQIAWRQRGGVKVEDSVDGDRRRIVATMQDLPFEPSEIGMVSYEDFSPQFVATSLKDRWELGQIYARESAPRSAPTPAIAAQAERIVGERTGEQAARAIYDWVASNIRYVAVYLDSNSGWIPHPAEDVMRNGYGDCKDHVALMQALLAARGIQSVPALVGWNTSFASPLLWGPIDYNHVILYLPDFDRYVNPTDRASTFDTLDTGLSGKRVTLAGGTTFGPAETPASHPSSNHYGFDSVVTIQADGTIEGRGRAWASGTGDMKLRAAIHGASSGEDLARSLLLTTPEGGFGSLSPTSANDLSTPISATMTWTSPKAVAMDGDAITMPVPVGADFLQVATLKKTLSDGMRRHAFLAGAYTDAWIYQIKPPADYRIARLPNDINMETGAGTYIARYRREQGNIAVERILVVNHDVFQAEDYPLIDALLRAAIDDSRATFMLAKTSPAP